jgi:hypothetical protein
MAIFDELFKDFKVNRLGYEDLPNHFDGKIKGVLSAAILQVENYTGRAIKLLKIETAIDFNAGQATLRPIPNKGDVYIEGHLHRTDSNGEIRIPAYFNRSLYCEWVSGIESIEQMPADMMEAVYHLASHLYTHDGSAINRASISGSTRSVENINDPIKDSGALALLGAYRRYAI